MMVHWSTHCKDTLTGLRKPHFHVHSDVSQVECCCFSPDGLLVLSGSDDHTLKVWRTHDGSLVNTLQGHTNWVRKPLFHVRSDVSQVRCCCFSPDGSLVLSGSDDHTLKVWTIHDGSLVNTLQGHTDYVTKPHFHVRSDVSQVRCCCFSPDGSLVLSGSRDHTLKVWRTHDGSLVNTLQGHTDSVTKTTLSFILMFIRFGLVVFHLMVRWFCLVLMTTLYN